MDVSDRFPYEAIDRLYPDAGPPPPRRDHHVSAVTLVSSSKKSGLARLFARLRPIDLVLYQALVDRLAPDIEAALPARDVVFAYRQSTGNEDDAFAGTPGRAAYAKQMQNILDFGYSDNFAITADIAGYFMHVDVSELERLLLSLSSQSDVVRDLGDGNDGLNWPHRDGLNWPHLRPIVA